MLNVYVNRGRKAWVDVIAKVKSYHRYQGLTELSYLVKNETSCSWISHFFWFGLVTWQTGERDGKLYFYRLLLVFCSVLGSCFHRDLLKEHSSHSVAVSWAVINGQTLETKPIATWKCLSSWFLLCLVLCMCLFWSHLQWCFAQAYDVQFIPCHLPK